MLPLSRNNFKWIKLLRFKTSYLAIFIAFALTSFLASENCKDQDTSLELEALKYLMIPDSNFKGERFFGHFVPYSKRHAKSGQKWSENDQK